MGGTYVALDVELSWADIPQNLTIHLLTVHCCRISMKTSFVSQEGGGARDGGNQSLQLLLITSQVLFKTAKQLKAPE